MAFTARTETYVNLASLTSPYNFTVTKPTGTVDGDILFTHIAFNNSVGTIDVVPTGWLPLADKVPASGYHYFLYYKIASGEGANWIWSTSATTKVRVVCSCYTGDFSRTNPIEAISNTTYITSDNQCRAASMNVSQTGCPLIFWAGCYSTSSKTFTKPTIPTSDWVENDDAGSTTPDFWTEVCSMVWAGSGDTGTMTATISATLTTKHAFAVALRRKTLPDLTTAERAHYELHLNRAKLDTPAASILVDSILSGATLPNIKHPAFAHDWLEHPESRTEIEGWN